MTDETVHNHPLRDAGDRRNADVLAESLKENQKRFDFAEKIAHTGSMEWYMKTARMIWSDEMFRILGFEPGSFTPTYERFTKSLHPYDSKKVLESIRETLEKRMPFDAEFRIVRPDAEMRDVRMIGEVYRDTRGHPLKMNGSVQDITEHKRMERRLAAQNEELLRFSAALDGMDDIVIITDSTGSIDYINRAGETNLGLPREKIRGRHISEFRNPGPGFELRKEIFIDDQKSTWTGSLDLINRHGMPVRTSLKSTPILKEGCSACRVFVLRVLF